MKHQPPSFHPASASQTGLVIASHGRHCVVETPDGERVICHPRGKKSAVVVGDRVAWQTSGDEGVIERVLERRNLLYRQDEIRTKSFAANIDLVLVLVAAEPVFSEKQLTRALIAAEAAHIQPLVALNKSDLTEPFAHAWARLAPYRDMGYAVVPLGLEHDADAELAPLRELLAGRATLVLGPSGAGKSTLINRLVPGAKALTREISQVLNTGKHTTTSTSWYWLDAARTTALIDSPGFQEFGLHHIEPAQLPAYMPDLRRHVKDCRFYNCTHLHEPGCGVRAEVVWPFEPGRISENRYAIYEELFAELSAPRY
ncbi:ribosome small subunit-dependent GTPase A [Comamonas serinivorans]|uniref:Small ribosomal subunit biogenesis GTPase RsgA n=1 Tax=Comamonas serinivorans TaxID=1082851 RepID=A0A1Y0EQI4_9BURK|nr:ribosome small subunit-dependent GTPase A [Comamonas serinivorans]ARU05690.1 ribosome small subunit-dependent GTPase A [Comamonas serinivorans]